MRVLVTGSGGLIGSAVVERLRAEACEVVEFDIADGHDVMDGPAMAAAAEGCDAIVHAAGGFGRGGGNEVSTITLNVTGNWNALTAAQEAGAKRVVTFSSVNALGVFRGEARPDYLPIDDDHPIRPPTAYGIAKRLIEEMCRCFTATTGISTVCFRPPAVLGPERRALRGRASRRSGRRMDSVLGIWLLHRCSRCRLGCARRIALARGRSLDRAHLRRRCDLACTGARARAAADARGALEGTRTNRSECPAGTV
jgi:nucleoside-diphosphate-sugar epimerase